LKILGLLIKIIVVTTIVVGGLIFFVDKIFFPQIVNQGANIKVPNLIGEDLDDALLLLEGKQFEGIKSKVKVDYNYPAGAVIAQIPKQGSICKPGRRIYLTISAGAKPAEVPELKAISPLDAKYRIAKAKLKLDSTLYDYSSDYPEGVVMGQTLEAGTLVPLGDSLSIVISLGPELDSYIVPDLSELPLSDAIEKINTSGFSVEMVSKVYDEERVPNTVISQFPEAETITDKGSSIILYISTLDEEFKIEEESIEEE
jgi:serine/threonine-protein kinase